MNLLDLIVAVLFAGFAVSGIARGLVRQLFSLGGWLPDIWRGSVLRLRAGETRLSFQYAEVVANAVVFLAAYLAVPADRRADRGAGAEVETVGADRLAGMAAGLVKGALLSILIVFCW